MSDDWIRATTIFDGLNCRSEVGLRLSGGVIAEIGEPPAVCREVPGLVTPGFCDVQVNGGGGVLLNSDPTAAGIRTIVEAHRGYGTAFVFPTLITDQPDQMVRVTQAAQRAWGLTGFAGIHLEGPHVSPDRAGTHNASAMRPFDQATLACVTDLTAAGIPVLLTVAPEVVDTETVEQLVGLGVTVSLGHSAATAKQARAAFGAGARSVTHLFNAMSQMTQREAGLVGATINSDVYAGLICDGIHVADEMLRLALRARPVSDRMYLVSDAMPTVGGPYEFDLYGQRISLSDGRLINQDGQLAGAHLTMAQAVHRCHTKLGVPLDAALRMATSIPAECVGLPDLGQLVGQSAQNVMWFDDDFGLISSLADAMAA